MRRIRLTVAYDGTNYVGWQIQPNGLSIEAVLNRELSHLLKEDIHVIGASRTDSGVHADGNVCVFDTESMIPADKFKFALNVGLPSDIVVQESDEVPLNYHPRKMASVKTYEYRILNRELPLPKERNYAHFYHYPLDVDRMRQAAEVLIGTHDFSSFCSIHTNVTDFVRTVYSIDIDRTDDVITIRIVGNGFLYNMVRIIVGTLKEIGTGFRPVEDMQRILDARDRAEAGATAPANGLTLKSIVPGESTLKTLQADDPAGEMLSMEGEE